MTEPRVVLRAERGGAWRAVYHAVSIVGALAFIVFFSWLYFAVGVRGVVTLSIGVGFLVLAYSAWDSLKSFGVVPVATVTIGATGLRLRSPLVPPPLAGGWLRASPEPLLWTSGRSKFYRYWREVFWLANDKGAVRVASAQRVSDASLAALREALGAIGASLERSHDDVPWTGRPRVPLSSAGADTARVPLLEVGPGGGLTQVVSCPRRSLAIVPLGVDEPVREGEKWLTHQDAFLHVASLKRLGSDSVEVALVEGPRATGEKPAASSNPKVLFDRLSLIGRDGDVVNVALRTPVTAFEAYRDPGDDRRVTVHLLR